MAPNVIVNRPIEESLNKDKVLYIGTIAIWTFFIALIIMSCKNFLAFHTGVELFSSIIGFGIFIMCINTFPISKNKFVMVLGIGYCFIAMADILHALIYPGVKVFNQGTLQVSTKIWIVASYLEAITLLLSSLIASDRFKRINLNMIFLAYLLVSAVCLVSILVYPIFPECYIPGVGLTTFKTISEYIISVTLAITGIWYFIHRKSLDRELFFYMELNIIFTFASELIFSRYILPDDPTNIIGHLLKVLSFYFVYKSVIEHGLNKPYSQLFNNMNEAKETIGKKITEIQLINKELSEIKSYSGEMEKILMENEVFFDLLLQKSPLTIYAHSEGKFIFANNMAAEMFGLESPYELIGKSLIEFTPEGYRSTISNYINESYKDIGRIDSFDSKILNTHGEVIDVSISRTTFNYKEKPASLCILWDISAMSQVENLKKDIQQKKRLLDESLEFNRLIKEFFANLSHELRTPLNVILGALQVVGLNRENESAEVRVARYEKYCKTTKQNCYRLLRLINNLIDISKIDAGFFNLNLKNHNIISLVEDITLSVAVYVEDKGVNLIFDTDVEEKIMACDPDKIERIILNMLSNAIKFTSPGDDILVSMTDEGDSISISVKDTGVGIPKEKLSIIFERFRQANSSLSRNQEGSGIGLSLTKSLIEMHGGTISVQSQEGVGTEFVVRIPVKVLDEEYDNQKDMMYNNNVERISIEFSDIYT